MHIRDCFSSRDGGFVTVNVAPGSSFSDPYWVTIGVIRRDEKILILFGDEETILIPSANGTYVCLCKQSTHGPCTHVHVAAVALFGLHRTNDPMFPTLFSKEELEKWALAAPVSLSQALGDVAF